MSPTGLRAARDIVLGLVWAGLGLWQAAVIGSPRTVAAVAVVLIFSAAAGLFSRAPLVALLLLCVGTTVHVVAGVTPLAAELAVLLVAYGVARHGRRLTLWLGGVAIPLGAGVAEFYAFRHATVLPSSVGVVAPLLRYTGVGVVSVFILGIALLGAPWLLGLLVRLNARYRRSLVERERAQSQAEASQHAQALKAGQVQLARDVHDMVGHSLAVIIAQADAGLVKTGDADDAVRDALGNIAAVARGSLGDVRGVLSRTQDNAPPSPPSALDLGDLIGQVTAAGNDVHATTRGRPAEIGPARRAVLYRVLQEMLTNAMKHGSREGRIHVEQTWQRNSVTLLVSNPVSGADRPALDSTAAGGTAGMGLASMRQRLQDVGGALSLVEIHDADQVPYFRATALIPFDDEVAAS